MKGPDPGNFPAATHGGSPRDAALGIGLDTVSVLVDGLDHPEGVTPDPTGTILFAGGEGGQIYRVEPVRGTIEQVAAVDGFVLGVCMDNSGHLYACAGEVIWQVDVASGDCHIYAAGADYGRMVLPNFAAFDDAGWLYVSDSGDQKLGGRPGWVVRVPPGGGIAERVSTSRFDFPNGLAVDGDSLLLAESGTGRVLRLRQRQDPSVFAQCSPGVIDGLALDSEAGVIVSFFQPNRVERHLPNGRAAVLLDDPWGWQVFTPTNCCFYGPGLRELALASLGGQAIASLPTSFGGRSLSYPEIPSIRTRR